MSKKHANSTQQKIEKAGKNALQVGGNYTQSSSFNINILISIFFISVLALGGLAWAINLGMNKGGNSQSSTGQPPTGAETTEMIEP
ncbi:MAG: hypothetical protein AAFO06_20970 [Cyanobacteria bacterium J06597_16]